MTRMLNDMSRPSLPVMPSATKKHLPQIDGLRGIAILLILLHHCFGTMFNFFWIGVDLFFVLSGFLITNILIETKQQSSYFRNFYMRRTLRIFPLYYAALILTIIVFPYFHLFGFENTHYLQEHQSWFWLYMENWLFFRDGWPPGQNVAMSHFWSLAIEEQYYLVWPMLIFLFRKNINAVMVIACTLIVTAILFRTFGNINDPGFYIGTHTRMDSLLVGSMISLLLVANENILRLLSKKVLVIALALVVITLVVTRDVSHANVVFRTVGYTVIALFFAAVVYLSLNETGLLYKMLNKPLLKFFGKYSYGLYVFHFPVFHTVRLPFYDKLSTFMGFVPAKLLTSFSAVGITLILAMLSFKFLESPFLKLKKYF